MAVFEGSITLFGKNFNMIQKYVSFLLKVWCEWNADGKWFCCEWFRVGKNQDSAGGDRILLRLEEDQPLQGVEKELYP